MSLSDTLRQGAGPIWEKMVTHPFVKEMGDGTLPVGKFSAYFIQDYLFVKDFSQFLSLALAKAPDFDAARHISGFLNAALNGEEGLFRRVFEQLGITKAQYTRARPAPTTVAYGNFLVRLGYDGSFSEIMSAMLPVEWTYLDWAKRLVAAGKRPTNPVYQEWTDIHAAKELEDYVGWMRRTVDGAARTGRGRMQALFTTAVRYEYLFWEAAYRGEKWPG